MDPDGTPPPRASRYPAFDVGREAIADADASMAAVLEADDGACARGRERLELALTDGHVGDPAYDAWDELFSYPVARVLVSCVAGDGDAVLEAYAAAEAATLRSRAEADLERDRSDLGVYDLLDEFGLDAEPGPGSSWWIRVPYYLEHAPDADGWGLMDRRVVDGAVLVQRPDALTLAEQAARARIRDGLPYELSPGVRGSAETVAADLRDLLVAETPPMSFPVVDPSRFPPCLSALLSRSRSGEELPPRAELTLVATLGAAGMDARSISDLTGGGIPPAVAEGYNERLTGSDGLLFPTPNCQTMADYGLCTEPDERCDEIRHPLEYYSSALEDA